MHATVRTAERADINLIAEIHAACWREAYFYLPQDVLANRDAAFRARQWCAWFDNPPPGSALYLAENQSGLIGFSFACLNVDPAIPEALGELHAAYILPDHRGGATGALLLLAMVDGLDAVQAMPACLWTWTRNPMRLTYAAAGFQPKVRRDRMIAGHALPEVGYLTPDAGSLRIRIERFIALCASSPRPRNQRFYHERRFPGFVRAGRD